MARRAGAGVLSPPRVLALARGQAVPKSLGLHNVQYMALYFAQARPEIRS